MNKVGWIIGCCWPIVALPADAEVPAGQLVWASDRLDGRHEIYRSNPDGSDSVRLTHQGGTMATWSPDGRWLAYWDFAGHTRVMRWDGSDEHEIFAGIPNVPDGAKVPHFWLHDNSGLVGRDQDSFYLINPETSEAMLLFELADLTAVAQSMFVVTAASRDNRLLLGFTDLYRAGHPDPQITFTGNNAVVALDRLDPRTAWFLGPGCEPTTSPSAELLIHVYDRENSSANPLAALDLADYQTRASHETFLSFEDPEWGHQYFPRLSNDGDFLVYSASTGCQNHDRCDYDVFLHEPAGLPDNRRRIVQHPSNDQWPHLRTGAPFPLDRKLHLSRTLLIVHANRELAPPVPDPVELLAWQGPAPTALDVVLEHRTGEPWLSMAPVVEGQRVFLTSTLDIAGLPAGVHRQRARVLLDGQEHPALSLTVELRLTGHAEEKPPPPEGGCAVNGCAPPPAASLLATLLAAVALCRQANRRRGAR